MNQGHSPTDFIIPASKKRRLIAPVLYLKGGSYDRVSNAQQLNFSILGYSSPKCSCNNKYTHSSEFMIHTRMSTCYG